MRRFNAKNGFMETSPDWLVRFCAEHPGGARFLAWLGMTPRGKHKNRGNEAKKYLKTKDITFLSGANDVSFAGKVAQITA